MAHGRTAALLVVAVSLAACGADDGGDTCLPECTADRDYDALEYHLAADFDFGTSLLTARETITLAVGAGSSGVIELDAGAAMLVDEVSGAAVRGWHFDAAAQTLAVELAGAAGTEAAIEVAYTAPLGSSLRFGGPRDDDPVASYLVYTDSEPDRAKQWLICNDNPADRARWSTEFHPAAGFDAIANGARAELDGGGVGYTMDDPIPTYLMAFALGQLSHVDRSGGSVPLSVWYRTGLPVDADATLDVVADAMATFEAKLGPYPFDTYAVVLLPGYGGGMENATITFNLENSSVLTPSFGLNAHELAHHWFGDYVTMRTYDDVWVKEGMATLLAAEADRARRDRNAASTRLFGYEFAFDPSEAIVDPELVGLEKYGSGPYERAAWLITQIRHEVGEDAFWAALRQVLADHALGTITGEEFIAAFPLDPAVSARAVASLTLHTVPTLAFDISDTAGGTLISITVDDPDAALIAPFEVAVVDASGAVDAWDLAPGAWADVTVPPGGYFELDADDVHPSVVVSFDVGDAEDALAALALTAPTEATGATTAALDVFETRSAAAQERGLDAVGAPTSDPAELAALYTALDSSYARRGLLTSACGLATALGGAEQTALAAALAPAFDAPEVPVLDPTLGWCGPAAGAPHAAELAALIAAATPEAGPRIDYLLSFDYGVDGALNLAGELAITAPTLRLRERALQRLAYQAQGFFYEQPTGASRDAYTAFFRDRLAAATSETRVRQVWSPERALGDLEAVPVLAPKLHGTVTSTVVQYQLVCDVAVLTGGTGDVWAAFQTATMPWDTLGDIAAAALADPQSCPSDRRAAPPALRQSSDGGEQLAD